MKGDCQGGRPGVWSIVLLLAVIDLLVMSIVWHETRWSPRATTFDEEYQYDFMLTENSSSYVIEADFYHSVEIAIKELLTNETPITLTVTSSNGTTHLFRNLTTIIDETLIILPQSWSTEMAFSRQSEDASVSVILVVTREMWIAVEATYVILWPLLVVPVCLGGFALWRLNSIERACQARLAYQARWRARNGLGLVAILVILAGAMIAPFVGTWLSGDYRQVQNAVVTHEEREIYVDVDDPVISVDLLYFAEEHPMEGIFVSSIVSEHQIGLEVWQDSNLLLRLPSITNLNQSYIRVGEPRYTRLDILRIAEDSTVLVTIGFEKTVTEMANDPVPLLAIMVAAVIPLASGMQRLSLIGSIRKNGPYLAEEEDVLPSSGAEVE